MVGNFCAFTLNNREVTWLNKININIKRQIKELSKLHKTFYSNAIKAQFFSAIWTMDSKVDYILDHKTRLNVYWECWNSYLFSIWQKWN